MNHPEINSQPAIILPTPGSLVKGRIIGAGIPLNKLAAEAKIKKNTLSNYISGRLRRPGTQFDIWFAFRRLTGSEITMDAFWGTLLTRRPSWTRSIAGRRRDA